MLSGTRCSIHVASLPLSQRQRGDELAQWSKRWRTVHEITSRIGSEILRGRISRAVRRLIEVSLLEDIISGVYLEGRLHPPEHFSACALHLLLIKVVCPQIGPGGNQPSGRFLGD